MRKELAWIEAAAIGGWLAAAGSVLSCSSSSPSTTNETNPDARSGSAGVGVCMKVIQVGISTRLNLRT